jgi:hypothetical protein
MYILLPLLRRIVLWSVAIIALLLLLWVGVCLEERWRWRRARSTYRSGALARGVKLEVNALQQPAISDDENFAAAPIIHDLFGDPTKGGSNAKWFAALKVENYRRPKLTKSLQSGITDLVSLRDHFVAQGILSEQSESVAADVLRALERV